MFVKHGIIACLLCTLGLAVGCSSTASRLSSFMAPPIEAPAPPPAEWKPITFIDNPKLQKGVGPMDESVPADFATTDSGLKYRVLRSSSAEKPSEASTVTVNYRGWLSNGKVFDSSYERGEPTTFGLGGVIAGWTEGLQLVGEGGMIELWVPSRLGYGERGSPGSIPAHSDLHFIVELERVQ